jgi:hypothetical protein
VREDILPDMQDFHPKEIQQEHSYVEIMGEVNKFGRMQSMPLSGG